MTDPRLIFNPPPGWPKPPKNWTPPKDWTPHPSWPSPPNGWQLWVPAEPATPAQTSLTGDPQALESGTGSRPRIESSTLAQAATSDGERLVALEAENTALRAKLESIASSGVVELRDEQILQNVGIYRYHHPLENAAAYRKRLDELGGRIADLVRASGAIEVSNTFTFDNSLAKGRRMTDDLSKLMLRAYNAEVDNSLRALHVGNILTAKKRVEASRTAIAKLGKMMEMRISDPFHALRLEEIELTADFLMKKQEEREAAREERARLREERRVAEELAAEREKLDKERAHIVNAIESLRATGQLDPELVERLSKIDNAITQNDYRAANIRAGYVYVISNRGAFGEGVVKIGLTRRLEPMERVYELGGASVPFHFDVHALFFAEDAVTLEAELHSYFQHRRVNYANTRKEFFFAHPTEVRDVLLSKMGNLLEFTDSAESTEFLQSLHYWPEERRSTYSLL